MIPTRHSYDLVAPRYAAELGDELRAKPIDRALLDMLVELADGGPVVDLGCGPGHVTAYLADQGARVVGLDLSVVMARIASTVTSRPCAAADMTALPVRAGSVAGLVSLYAVIHLDEAGRRTAYAELGRILAPGGHALIGFHTSDAETVAGQSRTLNRWMDQDVDLTFHFLDPVTETGALAAAGLQVIARLDRAPHPDTEHASERTYLLLRRTAE